jgi:hypothetical protein
MPPLIPDTGPRPSREPQPGGGLPGEMPIPRPDRGPPPTPRPYAPDDPGINEPVGPGSEPDYLPGGPTDPGIRL